MQRETHAGSPSAEGLQHLGDLTQSASEFCGHLEQLGELPLGSALDRVGWRRDSICSTDIGITAGDSAQIGLLWVGDGDAGPAPGSSRTAAHAKGSRAMNQRQHLRKPERRRLPLRLMPRVQPNALGSTISYETWTNGSAWSLAPVRVVRVAIRPSDQINDDRSWMQVLDDDPEFPTRPAKPISELADDGWLWRPSHAVRELRARLRG